MAFSLSGSVITQTGTDTDLSGLAGIAGVVVTDATAKKYYYTNSRKLSISGSLTIDPEREEMIFGPSSPTNSITVNNGGTLFVGKEFSAGGKTRYTQGTAISSEPFGPGYNNVGTIDVLSGGTLDVKGASMLLGGSLIFRSGSNWIVRDGKFIERYQSKDTRIRVNAGAILDVEGIECYGIWINFLGAVAKFDGYKPILASGVEFVYDQFSLRDYDGKDAIDGYYTQEDGNSYGSARVSLINPVQGSDGDWRVANEQSGNGVFELSKEIQFNVTNSVGDPLQDVLIYTKDTDNGSRLDLNLRHGGLTDYVSDRFYTSQTDAQGNSPIMDVMTCAVRLLNTKDRRSLNNSSDDTFNFSLVSYNKLLGFTSQQMKGAGVLKVDWTLFSDNLINEPNKTIAEAYTAIETPQKWYDRDKSDLVDNYLGETQTYTSREGSTVLAGSSNITLEAGTNADPIQQTLSGGVVTSETVYIGAGFTGTINTTGTVTDNGSPRTISYGVTGGQLVIPDASGEWTVDGTVTIDDIQNTDGANNLVVNVTGGASVSTTTPGTGPGQVRIVQSVPVEITVTDTSGTTIQDARVYIVEDGTSNVVLEGLTDASGKISTSFAGATPQAISGRARKSSSAPFYKTGQISGTITSTGFSATVLMLLDQ